VRESGGSAVTKLRTKRSIGASLRERIRGCAAVVVLLSPFTLESGATQWMELAYADAFGIPTFVLLHHLTVDQLRRAEKGVPPLVLERNCTPAIDWRLLVVLGVVVKMMPERDQPGAKV